MSYILEALKKSERERGEKSIPGPQSVPFYEDVEAATRGSTWYVAAGAVTLAATAFGLGWLRPWQPGPDVQPQPWQSAPESPPRPAAAAAPPAISAPDPGLQSKLSANQQGIREENPQWTGRGAGQADAGDADILNPRPKAAPPPVARAPIQEERKALAPAARRPFSKRAPIQEEREALALAAPPPVSKRAPIREEREALALAAQPPPPVPKRAPIRDEWKAPAAAAQPPAPKSALNEDEQAMLDEPGLEADEEENEPDDAEFPSAATPEIATPRERVAAVRRERLARSMAVKPPAPPAAEPVAARAETRAMAVSPAAPSPAAPPARILGFAELPAEIQRGIPKLRITGHGESEDNTRIALINDRVVREGDEVTAGLKLERIDSNGVILNYRGYRFYPAP